jgi:hypothetical protein
VIDLLGVLDEEGVFVVVNVADGDGETLGVIAEDIVGVGVATPDAPPLIVFDSVGSGVGVLLGEGVGDGVDDAITMPATYSPAP